MHSSETLSSEDFEISIKGRRATLADLLPGFGEQSRLGVVVTEGFGATGASTLLMAAVTGFYDIQRRDHPEGFFRYADYFLFHVGGPHGAHHMLDVFPDHKEVVVGTAPEEVLRAINDRGVTHLVVPDGPPQEADFEAQTVNGATARLLAAYAYSASGRVSDPDVEIRGTAQVDVYVRETLRAADELERYEAEGVTAAELAWLKARLDEVPDDLSREMLAARGALRVEGRTLESFRRLTPAAALALL